jgi:hypothetical protein
LLQNEALYRLLKAAGASSTYQLCDLSPQELFRITYIPGPKTIAGNKFDDSLMLLEYLGLADEGSANKVSSQVNAGPARSIVIWA